jgi:hypothetical protein
MGKTEFLTLIEKEQLLKEYSSGNDVAFDAILSEFDRLESRIKTLELAASVIIKKASRASVPDRESVLSSINGVTK